MDQLDCPGAFVLRAGETGFYAGESKNIRARLQDMLANEKWRHLGIESVDVVPEKGNLASLFALQSALALREHPMLNCRLLMHESELPKQPR